MKAQMQYIKYLLHGNMLHFSYKAEGSYISCYELAIKPHIRFAYLFMQCLTLVAYMETRDNRHQKSGRRLHLDSV